MGRYVNRTGQRYGRLTVICDGGRRRGRVMWLCRCDCGKEILVSSSSLSTGNTRSCGCLHSEQAVENIRPWHEDHDMDGTASGKLYCSWRDMLRRCYDERSVSYPNYGGRGITVCEEWHTFRPFRDWAFQSGYEEGLSIDRIDNDIGYCPENCCWTTRKRQNNNKRSNIRIEYDGRNMTASEWAEETGINYRTLIARYNRGWTPEEILTTPPSPANNKSKRKFL